MTRTYFVVFNCPLSNCRLYHLESHYVPDNCISFTSGIIVVDKHILPSEQCFFILSILKYRNNTVQHNHVSIQSCELKAHCSSVFTGSYTFNFTL